MKREAKQEAKQEALATIAQQIFGLNNLETQNSDRLDFHEVAVWQIRAALQAAWELGYKEASK